jgi:hypothetical protein
VGVTLIAKRALPFEIFSTPRSVPKSATIFSVLDEELDFALITRWTPGCLAIAAFVVASTELVVTALAYAAVPRAAEIASAVVASASTWKRLGTLRRTERATSPT